MRRMPAWCAGLLAVFMTLGCQTPTTPPTGGDAPVQVRLQLNAYRVQAVVAAPTVADVNHVVLAVYRSGQAVEGATRKISADALNAPFTLSRLRLGTTYEIRATAFADADGTLPLSVPDLSRATFTTPNVIMAGGVATVDATPIAVSVPVKLADRVYNGQVPVTVTVARNGVRRVRLTLYRDGAIVYQPPVYEVAAAPSDLTVTLKNLKPGVGTYRVQAEGLPNAPTRGPSGPTGGADNVMSTAASPVSTLPVDGVLNDALTPITLLLN